MAQRKFIITDKGVLRMGVVSLHRELLRFGETCWGGGYYEFDYVSNRLILSGQSTDFGVPRWDWLDTLHVSHSFQGLRIIYVPTTRSWEDDVDVSEQLKVVYDM